MGNADKNSIYSILSFLDPKMESRLKDLLAQHIPEAEERVKRAHKQWNNSVRESLRQETALRFNIGSDTQSVPIKVEDGVPLSFARVVREFSEYLELLLLLPTLEQTVNGLKALLDYHPLISDKFFDGDPFATYEDVNRTYQLSQITLFKLKKIEFLKRIGSINEDIFGSYFFERKYISLYWIPIALTSAMLGVSVEALTLVVLTHELAHAFTHLGKDIDCQQWKTEEFKRADLRIVEGLAQFYTCVICEKLYERYPVALIAYEKLLEIQSGPYTVHTDWAKDQKSRGEIVRVTMIKCRTTGITNYDEFQNLMASEAATLKKTK